VSHSGVLRLCAIALQALEQAAAHPMTDAQRAQAYATARSAHRKPPDLVDQMTPPPQQNESRPVAQLNTRHRAGRSRVLPTSPAMRVEEAQFLRRQ
jgi:hypothetical protein